ncbi:MAG: hypothetical protein GTO63_16440 [Anaerolineae bacterium]|nr:hypothetical protein [Anaerolineae bacterium]NIN96402.1 hypothetical protein [Anaerolineae bacterium]NIQ79438.1 hypothetical protein [Anaerolineae bacterium]
MVDRQTYRFSQQERDELLARGMTEQEVDRVYVEDLTHLRDGLRIKGYLLQPQEDGLYPVIIYNAGAEGPSQLEMTPCANEGYVVVSSRLGGHGGTRVKTSTAGLT